MRNIIATIAVLLSVCANAQYSEMLHAHITPTNKVVTGVPDWVKGAADYYTFGFRKDYSLNGFLSFAHGTNVVASGDFSFASGKSTLASAESSHAEGNGTVASGYSSHAEGCTTIARGNCSHAEGRYTTANGTYSHSSGVSSFASNNYSFVWSGVLPPTNPNDQNNKYGSNGDGTFNINPIGGIEGVYIGGTNLATILSSNSSHDIDLEGFATEADLLAFYYPDGSVTSMDQITTNGIQYAVGSDGGAYVVSGNGLSGNVVLPWKVNIGGKEYNVTAIGQSAFDGDYYYDNSFNRFTAPITVNSIGSYALYFCNSLQSVSLPSVTSIGYDAFGYCTSLTSVSFPSVTRIGSGAFTSCSSLTSVNLPSATSIEDDAFYSCGSLTSLSLPSATSIGGYAFSACNSLQSVSLPSVTSIGNSAFINCVSLQSVSLHSVINISNSAFVNCHSITLIDFGSSPKSAVPSLDEYAFEGLPTTCRFIIPLGMYDEWIDAPYWSNLYAQGYKFEGYASIEQVKEFISAENPSFSNAVLSVGLNIDTNLVAILNGIVETFGGFPIEGTATTVGGLLAALAAAVSWLKKNKADKATTLPKYEFVDAAIADGVLTVAPFTNAKLTSDGTAFTVAVGGASTYMRDCVLRVECGDTVPTITWGANFHPRTDKETDFACEAGKRNIYWISEYAPNEFCVAGWQETMGGNAS